MIKKNLENIKNKIEKNAISQVEIVAATKQQSAKDINYLHELSSDIVMAENRAQEFVEKSSLLNSTIKCDFIGRLQSNKVKYLVGKVRYIQSVDRESLLKTIDNIAKKREVIQGCFLQINAGEEECKGGISFYAVIPFLEKAKQYSNIKIDGLMLVTPYKLTKKELADFFHKAKNLFDKHKDEYGLKYLSMGMSKDYILAIQCGANMVRIGTGIFGPRI